MPEKPDLHFILGNNPPVWAAQHAERWSQYANVIPWSWDSLVEEIGLSFAQFCEKVQDQRLRANYARHWLVAFRGGAYADYDTEPVSDPFRFKEWEGRFVIAPHPRMIPHVDNCFLYCDKPGNPLAVRLFEALDFGRLCGPQIYRLTRSEELLLRLDLPWNRDRQTKDAIIHHYYAGGSLDRKEMDWLISRVRGKKMTEAGSGLRSIELKERCDLTSLEHQPMFYERCKRGGCNVHLEEDLNKYPAKLRELAKGADCVLIDGRRRNECLEAIQDMSIPVYLHDSKRKRYRLPDRWRVAEECDVSERGLVKITR